MLSVFFTGCKKDEYYRDRYIGNWDFVTERTILQYDSNTGNYVRIGDDTIYYLGKIISGNLDYELIIQFTENDEIILAVADKKGTLCLPLPNPYRSFHGSSIGGFEKKDKIFLENIYRNHEIDVRILYSVKGTKKSKK